MSSFTFKTDFQAHVNVLSIIYRRPHMLILRRHQAQGQSETGKTLEGSFFFINTYKRVFFRVSLQMQLFLYYVFASFLCQYDAHCSKFSHCKMNGV